MSTVLGISFGIDSSAALLVDGRCVASVLEERFTRSKHERGWPSRSIQWCLEAGGTDIASVDAVAFFWNPALQLDFPHPGRARTYRHHGDFLHMALAWLLAAGRPLLGEVDCPWTMVRLPLAGRARPLDVYFVTHHAAHAASAFYPSPCEEAAVLTADGFGERECTVLWKATAEGGLERRARWFFPHSLGAVYAAVTGYLGFRPNSGEGKVMGLSPYGTDALHAAFRPLLGLDRPLPEGRCYEVDLGWFEFFLDTPSRVSPRFTARFGPVRQPADPIEDRHRDLAFALQRSTEEALCRLARRALEEAGSDQLCMAGGIAMNSVANGVIGRLPEVRTLWIQPAAGDGGTAAGAALYVAHEVLDRQTPRHRWIHDRFGPTSSSEQIEEVLARSGYRYERLPDEETLCERVAAALAEGLLVGWHQGPAELGARALGGRSILADPRREDIKDVLNSRVKFREPFRPFAPMVLAERLGDWFEQGVPVPFMQRVAPVRPEQRARVPGIVHVDGSARLQTVHREADPRMWALIAAFEQRTGVPIVVNTSFNVRGEPMVLHPADSLRCFASTGLDLLAIGQFLVHKLPSGARHS